MCLSRLIKIQVLWPKWYKLSFDYLFKKTRTILMHVIFSIIFLLSHLYVVPLLTRNSRRNKALPSNFLMVFNIFLMHSSQCSPTFNSTTYLHKRINSHIKGNLWANWRIIVLCYETYICHPPILNKVLLLLYYMLQWSLLLEEKNENKREKKVHKIAPSDNKKT